MPRCGLLAVLSITIVMIGGTAGIALRPVRDLQPAVEESHPLQLVPSALDFGEVSAPAVLTGKVAISNTSRHMIVIDQVTQSCTCTTTNFQGPVSLESGQKMELDVQLRVGENDSGPIRRSLSLVANHETLEIRPGSKPSVFG